jgi:hypothetical protein
MRAVVKAFLLPLAQAFVIGGIGLWYFLSSGVSAREQPGRIEEFVAGDFGPLYRCRAAPSGATSSSTSNRLTSRDRILTTIQDIFQCYHAELWRRPSLR